MTATVRLTEALIARPSVTPVDEGCQTLMAERLQAIGFTCQTLVFGPEDAPVTNLWAIKRGRGHAECSGNAGGGMGGAEGVVIAFVAARETAQAVQLAQRGHPVAATRQDLVRIGLMAHIPDDAVFGRVEHVMQGHRQLDRAQVGTQVATGTGNAVQQKLPQLFGQGLELLTRQLAQVMGGLDAG